MSVTLYLSLIERFNDIKKKTTKKKLCKKKWMIIFPTLFID